MLRSILLPLVFVFGSLLANSQVLPEFNMEAGLLITECDGILFDSGGEDATYGQSENLTTTIQTNGTITLTFFNQFCVQNNFDFLSIYDGLDANGTLLGQFTGVNMPPTLTANSGAVTFVFTSDQNVAYCGFSVEWESIIPPPTAPVMQVLSSPICNSSQVQVNFGQSYPCNIFQAANFQVSNQNETFGVTQIAGCSGGMTTFIAISLDHGIDYNCPLLIELYVEIPDACGTLYPFNISTTFNFVACGINAQANATAYTLCPGQCTDVFADVESCTNYQYSWNQGLPATAGPHTVCPTNNTTYTVTVTDPASQTSVVRSITITTSNAAITTADQNICQSAEDVILTANTSGEWFGDGLEAGTAIFDPDSVAGGGITYVYFESAGCLDSVMFNITAIQSENYTAACVNTGQFPLHATPPGGIWNGTFTSANGLFNPILAGTYLASYTINGCTDLTQITVASISGDFTLDTICQSAWFDTIAFAPPGGTWSGLGIVDDSLGVYSPEQTNGGLTQFTYSINGCNQVFEVFIKPIDIGGSYHTTCPEEAPLVWYDGPTPTPPNGVWSGVGLIDLTTGLFDPSTVPNDSYSTIYYDAPNGCSDTMTIYNLQTTIAPLFLDFCSTDPSMDLNTDEVGFFGPSGGVWSGDGVQFMGNGNYRFNPALAGLGNHTIYYDKNTCTDSLQMRVYNNALAVSNASFCSSDEPALLDASVTFGGQWTGSGIIDPATGLFDPGVAQPGQYYIYWSTPAGCEDSVLVTVEMALIAEIDNLNANYCVLNQEYTFDITPDGGVIGGNLISNTFNPSLLGEGNYEVIYTYDGPLCPASADTATFIIHPGLTNSLEASDLTLCQDQQVSIEASTSGGFPGTSGYSYQWSTGGLAFNSTTTALTTSQFISVVINDGCGPSLTDSIYIEVLPPIETTVATSDTLCTGEPGFASVAISPVGGDYVVSWNNTVSTSLNAPAGTSWQLVVLDNSTGCETSPQTVIIPSYTNVNANFIVTPNSACISFQDANNVNIIDLSQNTTMGLWDFSNGNELPYVPGQSINEQFNSPGNYTITLFAMNDAGCEDTASYTFCVLPEVPVFVPDIFSPNGDGNNDVLFVRGNGLARIEFRVYNRWGEEVFMSNDVSKGWDGQLRGSPSQSGSYFYSLKARLNNDTPLTLTGEIILVR